MNAPLVSIIIPFYNQERYLTRAVNSALQQLYVRIEIVLVDDGSTDGSWTIAAGLAQEYAHIVLVRTVHHSIGHARNKGVLAATGTYIAYLDSDDELEPEAIGDLVFVMETENADAVIGGFGMYTISGAMFRQSGMNGLERRLSAVTATVALCKEKIARVVWGKLFRAEIARQITFPEGIWFEDGPYLMDYFYRCKGYIAVMDSSTVKHYCRQDSVSRRLMSSKRITDTYKAFNIELDLTQDFEYHKIIEPHLFGYYFRALTDNLVILTMDHRAVHNSREIQGAFREVYKCFLKEKKNAGVNFGPRAGANNLLVSSLIRMGWNFLYRILPFARKKQFQRIGAIRSLDNQA